MSLSDHFKSFKKKKTPPEPEPAASIPPLSAIPASSHTLDELGHLIAQERSAGEMKRDAIEKELQGTRAALEKLEITTKSSRETQNQALQFLQQDAEREIKFFDRKLKEDMAHWDQQLKERGKAIELAIQQGQAGHAQSKTAAEDSESAGRQAADRAEALLKEQEAKLLEERQKWSELLRAKEAELLSVKQDLARREADLEKELKQQESQKKSSQELWQTRLQELERQWAEKRKSWEEAIKAKEEERTRLHSSLQEKQASWQLEQERRLHDVTRRQERAHEKLAALKTHLTKETQNWKDLSQSREEQIQQLKVKLLLSESEAKGQLDMAQKNYQESIGHITSQIQTLQSQLQKEQETWQKQSEAKDKAIKALKEDFQTTLHRMEKDFSLRMTVLQSEKETLSAEFNNLQTQYQQTKNENQRLTDQMKEEQATLETAHLKRMAELQSQSHKESTVLQDQVALLEKQKLEAERDLETVRLRWQTDLLAKEQALKEAQNVVAPQEAELRKRYAAEEELVTRQVEALKTRVRAVERDLVRTRESIEKIEKEQTGVREALESDHRNKEEALAQRTTEQITRLQKRLDERRLALEAFLAMKKDEDKRVQTTLRTKEKERADLATRLQTLPQELEQALENKKKAVQKESEEVRARIASLEGELAKARDDSKTIVQSKAAQLAALRQSLESKHNELASTLKNHEQVLESERATIEKQISSAQSDMDRVRAHWEAEIGKKEKESQVLQAELRKQETLQRQVIESEQTKFDDQLVPLETERKTLTESLEKHRTEHAEAVASLESQNAECRIQIQKSLEQEKTDRIRMETRFLDARAEWKAKLGALASEREGVVQSGQDAFQEKTRHIEQLEEQIRGQTVAHEARRRELVHQATLKARTLQDIVKQIEHELKTTEELFPKELKQREATLLKLQENLATAKASHERTLARFERAQSTLERRGRQKQETLQAQLLAAQEEWAKKQAGRDSEIAALQSNLLAKEAERQGELDRMAKQFAEERFQLEKAKDELEWKLKDRKEIAERQLSARQKEIQTIENEIHRVKEQRDLELAQKATVFETEKQKLQTTLASLHKQIEDTHETQGASLAVKEQELQALLVRSKEHLRVLGEEFNQKVGLWRSTNDSLRGQIERLKGDVTQAQDHWEAIRKEKGNAVNALKLELAEWETRIKNDTDECERRYSQDRESLTTEVRKQEKVLQESLADYERRLAEQEDLMTRSTESIREQEQSSEAHWQASLEQWETDKQALQQKKAALEQELVDMQTQFQAELRRQDESTAKLQMEITFKETHAASQQERLQSQLQRDMDPLRDRLARLMSEEENQRRDWETQLRLKDDELKNLKARLALREKRVQDESRRRSNELDKLRKQVAQEVESARARYDIERTQLEKTLMQKREALARLQAALNEELRSEVAGTSQTAHTLQNERQQLEESLRQVLAQREQLRTHYETLFNTRDEEVLSVDQALATKEQELEAIRENAKEKAGRMRKKLEDLRHAHRTQSQKQTGLTSAAVWNAFESGVTFYQSQQWAEAAHAFEDCMQKDPKWGASYQYLALTYHAQGKDVEAAEIAERARQLDPGNTQLATWVDRLVVQIRERKAS